MTITTATILATGPCPDWTDERIAATLAHLDCSSWTALVESAAAREWADVSLADARLTLCRAMTPAMRIASVKRSTFIRLDAQIERWPDVDDDVQAVRGELLAWADGAEFGAADLREIREHAYAYAAAAAAAYDAAAYDAAYAAAAAAAYAAADAAAYAAAAAAAYAADEVMAGVLYMAHLLDGVTP